MPISFTTKYKLDPIKFSKKGAFDTILDTDSLFFINFVMVKNAKNSYLKKSYSRLTNCFKQIILLLDSSTKENDLFYKKAYDILDMTEFQEICLGYSKKSTAGSGTGDKLKRKILKTAKTIITAGIKEPEIFELLSLFEEGISPDRLSDFIGRTIKEDLIKYTDHIYDHFRVKEDKLNPYNNKNIILMPKEILHELPIAKGWDDIEEVCFKIRKFRDEINKEIGISWKSYSKAKKKSTLRKMLLNNKELFLDILKEYRNFSFDKYDFENDPTGEYIWYRKAKEYSEKYPLVLNFEKIETSEDIKKLVESICHKFKDLVENKGLWEVLFDSNGKSRKERIAQKLFLGIAHSYCEANDIDISPEVNSGRGAIDFKFSKGFNLKVIVEIKLSSNTKLDHGYSVQLIEYEKSENNSHSIYLILDIGANESKLKSLLLKHNRNIEKGINCPKIITVDAKKKKSASIA